MALGDFFQAKLFLLLGLLFPLGILYLPENLAPLPSDYSTPHHAIGSRFAVR